MTQNEDLTKTKRDERRHGFDRTAIHVHCAVELREILEMLTEGGKIVSQSSYIRKAIYEQLLRDFDFHLVDPVINQPGKRGKSRQIGV